MAEQFSTRASRDVREEDRMSFHPEQLKWLEKMFPEVIPTPDSTPSQMYWRGGTRAVLDVVRSRVRS